ncbi:PREDICTED: F-box protein At3g08750-like [Camelina sativa]|uniref:F-box protein At3g08750-like n=1 Tax=Camelina sativa TaxID=90675 RepID=A0ABM0XJ06_CAMSA|nr:PREDICTED: F-box protein At3g08750-like [Camelina sativa]
MAQAPANRFSSLPSELVEEILCRTPAESLNSVKTTCKQWYAIISSNARFKQKQLDHHIHTSQRFLRIDDERARQIMDPVTGIVTERPPAVQIMDPVTGIVTEIPIPDEFNDLLPVSWMVHCDGLMLCICKDWERRGGYVRLAVWNPLLGRIKWIEPSDDYWVHDYFGVGYDDDASRHNYKILRFGYNLGNKSRVYEIYEFMSDSWRGIDAGFDGDIVMKWECVSVKGHMYWLALKKERYFVLCFDFSEETFKDVCDCPDFWNDCSRLECFNGDRLSFLTQDGEGTRDIEVWMTNKLSDEVVSFASHFSVTTGPDPGPALLPRLRFLTCPGYSIGKHRNIMAWCEQTVEEDEEYTWVSVFTFYEIDESGVVTKQIETSRSLSTEYSELSTCSYVYVPSLTPVPE